MDDQELRLACAQMAGGNVQRARDIYEFTTGLKLVGNEWQTIFRDRDPGAEHMMKPLTVAVALGEGEEWQPFEPRNHARHAVHAIKFADGSIWDAFNGWRKPR